MTELQQLMSRFSALKIKEKEKPSLLKIAGCPHIENVWSNVLAFYLDPKREHLLGDLMLKSLLETAGCDVPVPDPLRIEVKREHTTGTGRRIDIVVLSDTFVLGIENKVNAPLYNDLPDYAATLKKLAGTEKKPVGIVLSKYPQCDLAGDFVNVLYADLLPAVRKRLEGYAGPADNRYLIFLLDFLNNIENNLNVNIMTNNPDLMNFILENEGGIVRLTGLYGEFRTYTTQKLYRVYEAIDTEKLQKKYLPLDIRPEVKKSFWTDSDENKTRVITCKITFGDIRLVIEAYLQHDDYYSLIYYGYFEEKGKYPLLEEELEGKILRGNTRKDFLTSKEDEVASDLQNWLDEVLAYLAKRNTDTQL